MLYKMKCPINSPSPPVRGWHCTPTHPSLHEVVCCMQGNSKAVIPLVLVHWVGQRVNWLKQTETRHIVGRFRFRDPDAWAGYNSTVKYTEPMLLCKFKVGRYKVSDLGVLCFPQMRQELTLQRVSDDQNCWKPLASFGPISYTLFNLSRQRDPTNDTGPTLFMFHLH